jgi:hypothetical protein
VAKTTAVAKVFLAKYLKIQRRRPPAWPSFYIGGSAGAFLTGFAWNAAGWTGCVVMILAMQLIVAAIVAVAWER